MDTERTELTTEGTEGTTGSNEPTEGTDEERTEGVSLSCDGALTSTDAVTIDIDSPGNWVGKYGASFEILVSCTTTGVTGEGDSFLPKTDLRFSLALAASVAM